MAALHNPDLIKALAAWVGELKSPYHEEYKLNKCPVKLMSSSPNAWVEIKQTDRGMMEVTCIHRVIAQDENNDLDEIRKECAQFNSLMERVRLPVYVWEDEQKEEFQLRWQETLFTQTDLNYIQRFFEQSLYLANALQSRLGWALPHQTQTLPH
ncbi:MAG: hypothetical protein KJ798_10385 [Gammaproteobacteria bacterium]|uniref:hypothetical protein n=1 Tax=Limnobacter sp. TaxID=2003368 RepID=UPI001D5A2796|nr:hypothetical protein [Limnobacter sp.]MBU0782663.1 hypothetical protein [Gammaproteobacteria bacterium]MBU0850251.1 hypothetical protein [Gammaproteobacteria bacterium]MBU1266057.1 hypothetical protein [Gammaproteobacteria bacterium]MBU1530143.1 hypothetical protein [Gammaproteobacteria bacterium]MBU1780778.1 hypothetical protein [Gammaproteobacteria bacterium]